MAETKPGIDYEKLRELGVPEEVIESLDPADGGNITPTGEVLYLDEERMRRREGHRPPHRNHPTGLGIKDFIVTKVLATTPLTWNQTLRNFMLIVAGAKLTGRDDLPAKLYKTVMQFEPNETTHTHGNVMPLDVSVEDEAKSGVVPMDLIMEAIDRADYIGQMDKCICRSAHQCQHFDNHIGCLFFNMAGVTAVRNGLARPVTKEEAKAHVFEARDAGLVGQALYVEVEQLIWGFRNDKMNEFFELCFCCPCCCVAMDVCRNANRTIKSRFSGSGFTMVTNHENCIGCGKCIEKCPQDIITLGDDGVVHIDQEHCMGCGCCKSVCENDALRLEQTMPMRESIHEYFEKEGNIDLNMTTCTMEPPEPGYQWERPGLAKWGKLVAAMPGDIQRLGVGGYAKEHPGVVAIGAFALAAAAHVAYHRKK